MSSFAKLCCRLRFSAQVTCSRSVRRLCQGASNSKDGVLLSGKSDLSNVGKSDDDEDSTKIVQLVNTASEKDLAAMKHVSPNIATCIVSHREANGPFAEVRELLKVPGIGRQTLQRICRGILKPPLQVDVSGNGATTEAQQAGIAASRIESLQDIVAVDVGLRHLSWVYMTRDRQVWQWRVKDIVDIKAGKWDPPAYHKMVTDAIAEMPNPDLYVLEHQPYVNANKATYQMLLFQRTLQSMLFTALNHDQKETGTPHVISMLHTQVGRHFGLQVGGTRMSGQDVVAKILREEAEREDENDEDLPARLSWEDAETFHSATKHEKEHLANCLLQAIAFYDLVVDRVETDRAKIP
ncbi:transcription elongation factor, mitochondrial-like [Patiria miniata]|uniref:Transcription elongation factor, mitochondrial n=1 Tax=Patiria miniata TaxID=46514 RepID=A0A914AKX6_PATMI|nr:transcription elongation factor, mitochondrial-like [Patiria miniata]